MQELTAFHRFPPSPQSSLLLSPFLHPLPPSIGFTPSQPLSLVLRPSEAQFQSQTHHISAVTPKSVSPHHPSL